MDEVKKGTLLMRPDLKRSLMSVPVGSEVWFPINGFTVNTARSTAARINAEGKCKLSLREDYVNKRIYVTRQLL